MFLNFKKLIVFSFICNFAFADFNFNESCYISKKFEAQLSDGTEISGSLQLSFSEADVEKNEVTIPILNLSLTPQLKAKDISLVWTNPDLIDRNQNAIFTPEYQQSISKEANMPFKLYDLGGVYYSPFYGFLRSQHLIALFLSQNMVQLELKNKETGSEKIEISLSGSDSSLKELSLKCYLAQSALYLNEQATRKKPLYESWLNGYGLTSYGSVETYLPKAVAFPNQFYDITSNDDIQKSYLIGQKIYSQLKVKESAATKIAELSQDSNFLELSKLVSAKAEFLNDSLIQRNYLISDNGVLNDLNSKIESLESEIESVNKKIKNVESQIVPKNDNLTVLNNEIEIHENELEKFKLKITEIQNLKNDLDSKIFQLARISSEYSQSIKTELSEKQSSEILKTPYSFEEILNSEKEIKDLEEKKLLLISISDKIEILSKEFALIFSSYEKTMLAFEKLVNHKKELFKMQAESKTLNENLTVFQNELGGLDFKMISDLLSKKNNDEKIKNSEEKSQVIESIKALYKKYDTTILELSEKNSKLIYLRTLCKTDFFKKDYSDYCITPLEADFDNKVLSYMNEVSSFMISQLSSEVLESNSPIQRFDSGDRISLLVNKMKEEIKSPEFNFIKELWLNILLERWKYNVIKNLPQDEPFTIKIYSSSLEEQKKLFAEIRKNILVKNKDISSLNVKIEKLNNEFEDKENTFSNIFLKFKNQTHEQLNSLADTNYFSDLDCILEILEIEKCSAKVNLVKIQINEDKNSTSDGIIKNINFLVLTSSLEVAKLTDKKREALAELELLGLNQEAYVVENNFLEKRSTRDMLLKERSELQKALDQERVIYNNLNSELKLLSQNLLDKDVESKELDRLITSRRLEIQPLIKEVQTYCSRFDEDLLKLKKADEFIYTSLELNYKESKKTSVCEYEF